MAERRQLKLGLIGYGEVGNGIGQGLRAEGLTQVFAYDIASFEGVFSDLIQSRARKAGVELVRTPADLAKATDFIIAAVPGNECVPAARAIAPHLGPKHLYIEIASATPKVKQQVGEILGASGAQIADGGIMGSPINDGHRILIKTSGPAAPAFEAALNPWGMRMEVVSPTLGAGSGIKIVRSVVMKGMEALFHECAVGSARYGIQDEVFASICEFMDQRPFMETVKFLLRTGVIHAGRRAEEAGMSAEALEEVGVEPIMTRATVQRLQGVADMGLKEHFKGVVPDDHRIAVEAVDRALKRG